MEPEKVLIPSQACCKCLLNVGYDPDFKIYGLLFNFMGEDGECKGSSCITMNLQELEEHIAKLQQLIENSKNIKDDEWKIKS